jgi:hypothetical protein
LKYRICLKRESRHFGTDTCPTVVCDFYTPVVKCLDNYKATYCKFFAVVSEATARNLVNEREERIKKNLFQRPECFGTMDWEFEGICNRWSHCMFYAECRKNSRWK